MRSSAGFFRNTSTEDDKRELIIFVTPRLIEPGEKLRSSNPSQADRRFHAVRPDGAREGAVVFFQPDAPPRAIAGGAAIASARNPRLPMALRWLTAGESHGPGLTTILDGMPRDLRSMPPPSTPSWRAAKGLRARRPHEDRRATAPSSRRRAATARTLGSPIAIRIANLDHANWSEIMAPFGPGPEPPKRVVTAPRPGHADLAGGAKHGFDDLRDVLERASARETAARVALGAIARQLLGVFGVGIAAHVRSLGGIDSAARVPEDVSLDALTGRIAANDLACLDDAAYARMVEAIGAARAAGDTLGGVVEVLAWGLPPGLGSHVHWDRKLDGRLGQAMLSIPAVKGVEIGPAFDNARLPGSQGARPGATRRARRAASQPQPRRRASKAGSRTVKRSCSGSR
jgi:chorismate synthase